MSESFANTAVTGTASYPTAGTATSSAARSTLAISYDAATGNYTVTNGSRTQTFRPADLDAANSTGEANIYVRTVGNTTDSISISKNSAATGTISAPQYRYVGGGVWQQTVQTATSTSGTADAFTYGVATPNSAVPRTGTASFPVQLRGIAAFSDTILAARGSGTLSANFGSGSIGGTGTITVLSNTGTAAEGDRRWQTAAGLSATSGSFAGAFGLGRPFVASVVDTSGSITGRFYGPAAEELGASWFWTDNFIGTTFVGYMLGKNSTLFPTNSTLDKLVTNEAFPWATAGVTITRDTNTNKFLASGSVTHSPSGFAYNEATASFEMTYFGAPSGVLNAANRVAADSTAAFDSYVYNRSVLYNGVTTLTTPIQVWLFKPGPANPQLALSYTGFGYWLIKQKDMPSTIYLNEQRTAFAFGRATPAGGVPTTGTANYAGLIYGYSALPKAAGENQLPYTITGTSSLAFDFGAGRFNGSLNPTATNPGTGIAYNLGPVGFSSSNPGSPAYTPGAVDFAAQFDRTFSFIASSFNGHFTGPTANEMRGEWATGFTDPVNGGDLAMYGIMVGKRN